MFATRLTALGAVFALLSAVTAARADEGMWTFDNFPASAAFRATGVVIDQAWLDRVQGASVRLTSGCSGGVVSAKGLVLTNNHCVTDCAQSLSTPDRDLVGGGFMTQGQTEERQCPGMQAEILAAVVDVTGKVKAAVEGKDAAAFVRARDAAMAAEEKQACGDTARYRCQAVNFYHGGQYKIYIYRKYFDVRLVFAPELQTAFFGGDPDNFNFPRYDLDCAFLRLYEDEKPATTPDFLPWNPAPLIEGQPVFVAGNPGGTDRQLTVSQLESQRDLTLPMGQILRSELRGRLLRFSDESPEHKRIATDQVFGLENTFKAFSGRQLALNDAAFMQAKRQAEAALRARVAADPALAQAIGDPWAETSQAQAAEAELYAPYRLLETIPATFSELYGYARTLVRAARERAKPAAERLPEFGDPRIPLLEKQMLDTKPVYPELEQLNLAFWLSKTREYLTADDPRVKSLLGRESPEALSRRLESGTRMADPAVRKALWEGGLPAVLASDDPMIRFVLANDENARAVRGDWEARVSGPTDRAAQRIAQARFAVYGQSVYPDATFTLRLSYGRVAGWIYRGRSIPALTRMEGLFDRATGAEPFALAPRWLAAQGRLNPRTVLDVSTTNDIIGGNSGSPLIDARGRIIGAVFDGNIHSLGGDYGYDPAVNRAVAVSAAAITEALAKVYGQQALVAELTGR